MSLNIVIWHHSHDMVDEIMIHPSNNEVEKQFNRVHP